MLKVFKGNFITNGAVFSLPDNVYIDNVGEMEGVSGIRFATIDENIYIEVRGTNSECASDEFFSDTSIFEECASCGEITPIISNGLSGHYMLYEFTRENYCEFRYDLEEDDEGINTLCIIVCSEDKKITSQELFEHPVVRQLIESVHREE